MERFLALIIIIDAANKNKKKNTFSTLCKMFWSAGSRFIMEVLVRCVLVEMKWSSLFRIPKKFQFDCGDLCCVSGTSDVPLESFSRLRWVCYWFWINLSLFFRQLQSGKAETATPPTVHWLRWTNMSWEKITLGKQKEALVARVSLSF